MFEKMVETVYIYGDNRMEVKFRFEDSVKTIVEQVNKNKSAGLEAATGVWRYTAGKWSPPPCGIWFLPAGLLQPCGLPPLLYSL
ncbi:MAG: hypothetical protein LUG62_12255 [Clostridiales bacterium]|nr:hypothetical protein [Clostridiales bacterium]